MSDPMDTGPGRSKIVRRQAPSDEIDPAVRRSSSRSRPRSAGRNALAGPLGVIRASDVVPEPISWLWGGFIPRGCITVLEGDPGLGKSLLGSDLAARVSRGAPMPDGMAVGEAGRALLMSAEDDAATVLQPRLRAHGADLDRVLIAPPGIELPRDLRRIGQLVKQDRIDLVVVDPLTAFIGEGHDVNKDQDVRRVLTPLADMAARMNVAVVVVRHLRKGKTSAPIYRGAGSIGIIAAARVGLLVVRDPSQPDRCLLVVHKSNLGSPPPAEAFSIAEEGTTGVASIRWDGPADVDLDEALACPARRTSKLGIAQRLLEVLLSRGPMPVTDLQAEAAKAGISWRTFEAAKRSLGVTTTRHSISGGRGRGEWHWSLLEVTTVDTPSKTAKRLTRKTAALKPHEEHGGRTRLAPSPSETKTAKRRTRKVRP